MHRAIIVSLLIVFIFLLAYLTGLILDRENMLMYLLPAVMMGFVFWTLLGCYKMHEVESCLSRRIEMDKK